MSSGKKTIKKKTPKLSSSNKEKNPQKIFDLTWMQEAYQKLVEFTRIGFVIIQENKIVFVNPGICELCGYKEEEFLDFSPEDLRSLIHPDDQELMWEKWYERLEGKKLAPFSEFRFIRKDGDIKWVETISSRIEFQGKPAVQVAIIDITSRKQAENIEKESREQLELIADRTPGMIAYISVDQKYIYANKAYAEWFGISKEELPGKTVKEILDKRTYHGAVEYIERVIKGEQVSFYNIAEDWQGHKLDVFASFVPHLDDNNNVKAYFALIQDITRQKQIEEFLRESEERYKALYNRSLLLIYVHDFEGNFLDGNDTALKTLGYSRDEIISLNFAALLDEDQISIAMQSIPEIIQRESPEKPIEYKLRKKNGDFVWVEAEGSLLYKEGKPFAIQGIARDITSRKVAEQQLQESRANLSALIEYSQDSIWSVDREYRILTINPFFKQMFQVAYGEVLEVGTKITECVPPDLKKIWTERYKRALKGEYFVVEDVYEVDSQKIYTEISLNPIRHRDKVTGVSVFARNISAAKLTEEALRDSQKKYRTVIENANEAIFVVQDWTFKFFNPKSLEIIGYNEQEIRTIRFDNLIHPDHLNMVSDRYRKRLKGEELPQVYPFKVIDKNGKVKWVEVNPVLIEWEGRLATLNFLSDITERKIAEDQLKSSLKEKEVMLREIHHRVKNNLQIVSSLLRLQSRNVKDITAKGMFDASQNRIKSMALIHESLYRSKDLSKIDFKDYLEGMTAHLFSIYSSTSASIELNIDIVNVFLEINRAIPCGQIISELISNSLKHAFPDGGKGEIRIKMKVNPKGLYTLVIEDNGKGFPDTLDFRKTETLGLQLVTDLVKQINGEIELKKGKKKGTIYHIKF